MAIKTKRFINSRKSCSCSMPGVWRAVAYMTGVVVVFHSPKACAHVARTMDINAQYRTLADGRREERASIPLLSTQMQEKDAIFGGVERLTKCLKFAIEKYQPQCLVIANSCVAGVIGDDVDSVAREVEADYNIPVLTVDCCGFLDGEYYEGYFAITRQLLARFVKARAEKIPQSVILLGDNGGPWGQYATEVARLLEKMDVKILGQFPGYMDFDDLPQLAAAEAVIVLGGRGHIYKELDAVARQLHDTYGMSYAPDIYPIGMEQTLLWVEKMGALLGVEQKAQELIEKEKEATQKQIQKLLPITQNKKTLLCVGRLLKYFQPAMFIQTLQRLHMDVTGIVILDAYLPKEREEMLAALRKCASNIPLYNAAEGEELMCEADIVLTTHELQNKDIKQVFLPMLPIVGITGELNFMQGLCRSLCSRLKGGLSYV